MGYRVTERSREAGRGGPCRSGTTGALASATHHRKGLPIAGFGNGSVQVRVEKGLDACPGVHCGSGLRAHAGHPEQGTQRAWSVLRIVEKCVPCGRVLLHVVDDAGGRQRCLQLRCGTPECAVTAAVPADDRAGTAQRRPGRSRSASQARRPPRSSPPPEPAYFANARSTLTSEHLAAYVRT